jgi:diaminobutyrate-2-oxoglutarate transaminase
MSIFEDRWSVVRSYSRSWPAVFDRARGSWLYDEDGRPYLDFFVGAGSLNYGHNNPALKQPLLEYLAADRIAHSLDVNTVAKRDFLVDFEQLILRPRGLDYRVQLAGPGGTNAVEAALKLARKATGRTNVVHFENAFHGMTLGALAVTANPFYRGGAGVPLANTTVWPFDQPELCATPDGSWFDMLWQKYGDGSAAPAGVIVETVQGEGGVHVARPEWLRALADWCAGQSAALIIDDVQAGCGRTGPFFSFETAGIVPDLVCVSKSISGYGLPLALTLIRPDLDLWQPGEHSGTFRGVDLSFVTGAAALRAYWHDDALELATAEKSERIKTALGQLVQSMPEMCSAARHRGLIQGLEFVSGDLARDVRDAAFDLGLLVETSGRRGEVLKVLPSLTVADEDLDRGLEILVEATTKVCG